MATKGVIDIYATHATWEERTRHIFTRMYLRLYAAVTGNMLELIALQFGVGGSGSAAAPVFGTRAFAVFRWKRTGQAGITTSRTHSLYILIQCATDGNISGAQGAGAIANDPGAAACMFGLAAAMGDNTGDASPWNGTTAADGTDTKGSPVWSGPGTEYAFPRANALDGTATDRREMVAILTHAGGAGAPATRAHLVFDEDNISFFVSPDDNGVYDGASFVLTAPRATITRPVPAMAMIRNASGAPIGGALYPPTNAHYNLYYNGGVIGRTGAATHDVTCFQVALPAFLSSDWEPNRQLEPNEYEEAPIDYAVVDGDGRNGRVGNLGAFLRVCANVPSHSTNTGRTRAVFAITATPTDWKWVIPWDGATDPGVSVVPNGISF
jgi:hypothetical protein